MGLANDIRKKLDKKGKELTELKDKRNQVHSTLREMDTQIRELKAALSAYEEVLRLAPEDSDNDIAESTMRVGSMVALSRDALRKHGKPMHVSDILKALGKDETHEQKVSLSSSLAAYVRKQQVFTRPEPNVFGLLEWSVAPECADELATDQTVVDDTVDRVAKASK